MENSRNKQFLSFKLCAILSSVMKSNEESLDPAQNVNHAFIQHVCTAQDPWLVNHQASARYRVDCHDIEVVCPGNPYAVH